MGRTQRAGRSRRKIKKVSRKKTALAAAPVRKGVVYWLSHPALLVTLQLLIGGIFILASAGKIINPEKFMSKVYEYSMMPDKFVPAFAYVMPWVEFITGLLLVLDVYVQGAGLVACGSLIAFMIAIAVQVSRGVSMDCGCFDFLIPDEKTGWAAIGRDAIMVALASLLVFFGKNRVNLYGLRDKFFKSK